jgi:GTP-binding protein Era
LDTRPGSRCGFIALVGAPNAGKSTLLNALVGAKVAIVSRKVQTTRVPVRGIANEGASQLVFIDTPGLFKPRRRLDRAMVEAATGTAGEADVVVLVVDCAKVDVDELEPIFERLPASGRQVILCLNKVDRIEKQKLLELASELNRKLAFAATFMISATSGSGVADLRADLARRVPEGPWHYPEDEITDQTERVAAAEVTREKIYEHLHDELPYQTTVETTAWKDLKDGSVRIEQTIFVERESQRSIVLGEGGRTIRHISMTARAEMARMFGRPVHLFLHVKQSAGWGEDPERYREMGLEFPRD